MGRYYNGDIEGKFWVGTQSSDDADFFGVSGNEPNYLEYYFGGDDEDILRVKEGVEECKKEVGNRKEQWEQFCKNEGVYNDEKLKTYWLKTFNETLSDNPEKDLKLEWIARLDLGEKILKCLEETGSCSFTAEL